MEVTDLMVGNWVVTSDGILKTVTRRDFEDNDFNRYSPIPLTPEILEKNKFRKNSIETWLYHLDDGNDWFIFDSNNYTIYRKEYNYIKECYEYIELFTVEYVHELQIILKICKIKKEIVL